MQVVITDHHECHENLPDAQAVVDCKRTDDTYPCFPAWRVSVWHSS